jgi:phosphate starvation-inducible protein PhoH and related proteins
MTLIIILLLLLTNVVCYKINEGCLNKNKFKKNIELNAKKRKTKNNNLLYLPKNKNQHEYKKYLDDEDVKLIISLGSAGTGKTLFACQKAINELKNDNLKKIIITRPVVSEEENIGFLPGDLMKKMEPWTKPIFDIFLEYYEKSELNLLLNNNKIEICPLIFMRGRTFKNCFIIADEMQNSSPLQMKMLLTRIGENSKLVITGDQAQSDIIKLNGLDDFINRLNEYEKSACLKPNKFNGIKIINFGNDDIERSNLVKNIINIYSHKDIAKTVLFENLTHNIDVQTNCNNNDTDLIYSSHYFSS